MVKESSSQSHPNSKVAVLWTDNCSTSLYYSKWEIEGSRNVPREEIKLLCVCVGGGGGGGGGVEL